MSTLQILTQLTALALVAASNLCCAAEVDANHPLVTVGAQTITTGAYVQQIRQGMRQRFYHGKVPQAELQKFGDEVLQQMIDRTLLLQEAKQRKLLANTAVIDAEIANYDKQYASSERWQKERAMRLPLLRSNLEEESLLKALETEVRKVPAPSEAQVREYYRNNPEKFTTPERMHVSLILLKVDPSSPATVWQAALKEGADIVEQLHQGADFSDLARLRSGDGSAEQGGDLGYIHKGMLPTEAQQVIEGLQPGDITEPVRVLQGVAVLRLNKRTEAKLNHLEQVKGRATDLLNRDNSDMAWHSLAKQLRQYTTIRIDQKALTALFAPAPTSEKSPTDQRSGEQK
jgi:parvulin-like peptidyl-prolyl isomerase